MSSDDFSENSDRKKKGGADPVRQLPDNFECQEPFKEIILLARTSQSVKVPRDFTATVMNRLSAAGKPGLYERIFRGAGRINIRRWTEVADATECALCFLLAGFFYFVLGLVLIVGLKAIAAPTPPVGWINVQPQLAFSTALGLSAIGIILLKKSDLAVKIAHIGTFIYIGFAVFNGLRIQGAPGNPFTIAGMLCYIGGALILGVFLLAILQKYQTNWKMNLKNMSGFTVIEIIAVLMVMAIIAAFVIGRPGGNSTDLVVQAEVLKAHLRYAQTQAINSTLNFGIESDGVGANYWLFKYDTSEIPPVVKLKLPSENADQVNLSGRGLSMTANAVVCFDTRGIPYTDNTAGTVQASDRTITLSDGANSMNITITKNTGFIQ